MYVIWIVCSIVLTYALLWLYMMVYYGCLYVYIRFLLWAQKEIKRVTANRI